MPGTPKWKIYRGGKNGEFIAATKYPEDAAAVVALYLDGVVKWDHKVVVWTSGAEEFAAGESYDRAAAIMRERCENYRQAAKARHEAKLDVIASEIED